MKTLLLTRHAHAIDNSGGISDKDRTLSQNGMQDASRLGKFLYGESYKPNRILCSSAARALATAQLVADQLKIDLKYVISSDDFYETSIRLMLREITELDNEWDQIMIIAHNPTLQYLTEQLLNDDSPDFEPSTTVIMQFEVDSWAEVAAGTASLVKVVPPDLL